jgi:uncharacterized protein YuzE
MNQTLQVKHVGSNATSLYEGAEEKIEKLKNVLMEFPGDIFGIEIWDEDGHVIFKWDSPNWS